MVETQDVDNSVENVENLTVRQTLGKTGKAADFVKNQRLFCQADRLGAGAVL